MVDSLSMKMVSACTKMHELSAEGITSKCIHHKIIKRLSWIHGQFNPVVETIEKRREPMPAMEAIYLIGSSEASVKCLLQDFSSQNRTTYKFAHVYFTEGESSG